MTQKNETEVSISLKEIRDNQRYCVLFRGVQLGLQKVGITDVIISSSGIKPNANGDDMLVFKITRWNIIPEGTLYVRKEVEL